METEKARETHKGRDGLRQMSLKLERGGKKRHLGRGEFLFFFLIRLSSFSF